MNPEIDPVNSAPVAQQVKDEEEISDVNLATFHVFKRESAGAERPRAMPASLARPTRAGRSAARKDWPVLATLEFDEA